MATPQGFLDLNNETDMPPVAESDVTANDILTAVAPQVSGKPSAIRFGSLPVSPGRSTLLVDSDPSRVRVGIAAANGSVFVSDTQQDPSLTDGSRYSAGAQVTPGQPYLTLETTSQLYVTCPNPVALKTNLVLNPSFETGAGGWSAAGTGTAIAVSTAQVFSGTQSLAVTIPASAAQYASAALFYFTPAAPGQQVTFSAYVYVPSGAPPLVLDATNESNDHYSAVSSSAVGWQRLTVTVTPATTATFAVTIRNAVAAGAGGPYTVYVDAVQAELGSVATSYVDGDSANAKWNGTRGNSTSTLYSSTPAVVSFFTESFSDS